MLLTKLIFQPYSAVYEQFAMQKQDLKIYIYIYYQQSEKVVNNQSWTGSLVKISNNFDTTHLRLHLTQKRKKPFTDCGKMTNSCEKMQYA